MEHWNRKDIQRGADFLLDELRKSSPTAISAFYDGTEERYRWLGEQFGMPPAEVDSYFHILWWIELAVEQLEAQGVVRTRPLKEPLADRTHDYLIALTEKGRRVLEGVESFTVRGDEPIVGITVKSNRNEGS
jgi:hypothetical protein